MSKKKKKLTPKAILQQTGSVPRRHIIRVGRNEPCPCGSGLKYKLCHESEGEAFLIEMTRKLEKARIKAQQQEAGVPWYKRFFSSLSSS